MMPRRITRHRSTAREYSMDGCIMRRGTYAGPNDELKGKRALLILPPDAPVRLGDGIAPKDAIQAQFDQIGLHCGGRFSCGVFRGGRDTIGRWNEATHPGYRIDVSHGWHEFPSRDFCIDDDLTP
jgi:hypothetical protein